CCSYNSGSTLLF
nr:immunoglobulin light chain junction region [Macaca mulatta]MPN79733.1 immunoglobulin light chain junction region [Macaca mulatta]MPN79799.1 immunoglobulin light chain junction region [Macaca mulatta]MPN79965.1 immunoglobulin light chain junction region [Macaca mulatta]MPN80241.1 immunoglobulin light chain junction region [Macaca mulatta]